jgi:hypothetical protein
MDKMKEWEVWMNVHKMRKQGQSGWGVKGYKSRGHKSRERSVLWCMTATEWKKRMTESKSRKQYWDEGQESQHNEERKTMKWNKKRKIGRRKRLRNEYLKVQTPQNYIHWTEHRMLSNTSEKICNTKNTNKSMLASCTHNMQYCDGCHPVVMSEQTNTQTLSDTTIPLIATQLHCFGLLHNC